MQTRTTQLVDQAHARHEGRSMASSASAAQLRQSGAAQVFDTRDTQSIQRQVQSMANQSSAVSQLKLLQAKMAGSAEVTQRVEEELVQSKFDGIQRVEEEEPLQSKSVTMQRVEDEEPLQAKFDTVQRAEDEELPSLQAKLATAQRLEDEEPAQAKLATAQLVEKTKPNNTGLPNQLKAGIESLSGMSMDHVQVHYNSSQPAQLNALAYAQGSDIHVAPGQEQHLPHEAWHVVQQAQGRVRPTMQMKEGVPVNDDAGLEHEADVMGAKAVAGVVQSKTDMLSGSKVNTILQTRKSNSLLQKKALIPVTQKMDGYGSAIQLYSYVPGTAKTIILKNASSTAQTNIDVCTQNSVTYATGDAKRTGTGTGTALWAGWLTDAGTENNATQLHVINQHLGGNGGSGDGNIGPGSQNLNSHHLHQAEKYVKNELFASTGAKHDFTYTCTFDYSNSVDKVHNTPTAKGTAIGDPAIKAKLTFNGTAPTVKSSNVAALESGVDVTNGKDMKFGKA